MKKQIDNVSKVTFNPATKCYEVYSNKNSLIVAIHEEVIDLLVDEYILIHKEPEMTLVLKDNAQEQVWKDEAEEHRRRAMERIAKLRNLSFNINEADPDNEFDNVPAYLRRNMELHKSIAEVETFYSNYTVKSDENNKAEITTINTFLDGKNPDQMNEHFEPVFIFLPANEISLMETEDLTNSCGQFMEALDYELKTENEPIFGSFIQKLIFKIKAGAKFTRTEIQQDFTKGKKALELKYVELPTAEQTEKLANSAAKIVEILDKQDEGIIRLGAIIVLKKQVDGKGKLIIHQLNSDMISILDKQPQLMFNLQTAYELLTGDVKGVKYLDETGTETLKTE